MPITRIILELPEALANELERIAEAFEIRDVNEAAVIGLADWIARRKSELDDRDPAQRYFINEALDQLATRKKD
ncbi:MAG TPA: hypothetical protein VGG60_16705 [Candidatus Binataceae bacterium]|jgi:hypothetical protein